MNFEIVRKITAVEWSTSGRVLIEDYLSSLKNEATKAVDFFEYCRKWKVAPWVYTQLERNRFHHLLSPEVLNLFQAEHQRILIQNENRNEVATQFLEEFVRQGIDVIILKGNYLAHVVYEDRGYKRMNDFDILVRREDWDRIQDIYLGLGYIPLGFGWSGEKEKPAKFSHVGMSFISPDYKCIIGTQWGLKSPTAGYTVNIDEAWSESVEFTFCNVPVRALSPEYNLLHLVLHMGVYKCGIRDCMDVYNLVLKQSFNEEKFFRIVQQAGALEKAWFTLNLCQLCCAALRPDFLTRFNTKKNHFLNRRLKMRLRVAVKQPDFQVSYNDYFQDIEKVVIYFNLFPKFHRKFVLYLKVLQLIYFPKKEVCLKLSDRYPNDSLLEGFMARLRAPYLVFSLIAQEIGWKFTVLLFVKLWVDLVISLKNYILPSESYFDYLKKRGIDPKEIVAAVKDIQ